MSKYVMVLLSISLTAAAQILLKLGVAASASPAAAPLSERVLRTTGSPYVLGGLAVYGLSTAFWLVALSELKLSVAYPMVSLSYVLVVLGSVWILGEQITASQIIGLCLIIAGVVFLVR